jgi:hypothetical protein
LAKKPGRGVGFKNLEKKNIFFAVRCLGGHACWTDNTEETTATITFINPMSYLKEDALHLPLSPKSELLADWQGIQKGWTEIGKEWRDSKVVPIGVKPGTLGQKELEGKKEDVKETLDKLVPIPKLQPRKEDFSETLRKIVLEGREADDVSKLTVDVPPRAPELLPAFKHTLRVKNIHGKPAYYGRCRQCERTMLYHNVRDILYGFLVDLCWACQRESSIGACWCDFCVDKAQVLCHTCGNKGPAQCECPTSPVLKEEFSVKKPEKEKKKKRKIMDPEKKVAQDLQLKSLTAGKTVRKWYWENPPMLFGEPLGISDTQLRAFCYHCINGTPLDLPVKEQNKLVERTCKAIKEGRDKATLILLGNDESTGNRFWGFSDETKD